MTKPNRPLMPSLDARKVIGNLKRLHLVVPGVAALAFAAMGCGGSFIGGNTASVLYGTWTLDSMTVNGSASQSCPGSVVVNSSTTVSCSRYTDKFNNDGTILRTSADGVTKTTGNYTYNGSVLTTAFGSEDHQVPITIASSSASFTATENLFGYTVVYTFVKS